MFVAPPWTPDMDSRSVVFFDWLNSKEYGGAIDALGKIRWPSDWRMHVGNGCNDAEAYDRVAQNIHEIRHGLFQTTWPVGRYDVPWAPSLDADAFDFFTRLNALYEAHQQRPIDPVGICRWSSDYRIYRANGRSHDAAWSAIEREILRIWKVSTQPSAGVPTRRPLIGPLRVVNKLFHDDTGPRRVFFCSWFTALRILRDDPAEFYRQLDAIATEGYQGIRVFFAVGGWSTYWDGREIAPVTFRKWFHSRETGLHRPASFGETIQAWPDYDDLVRELLRACRQRALRVHQAVGDMQILFPDAAGQAAELAFTERIARICAEEGGLEVMALVGDVNEYPQNHYGADSPASIAQIGRTLAIWRRHIPNVLTTMGASISEEPDQLFESITHGDVCAAHTSRGMPLALRRTHALVHWEGHYRSFPKPFWQGEPMGWGAAVSVDRITDNAYGVALYAMHALTGQASNYFNGPAIHSREPLESTWGFTELPRLFDACLPEDLATWDHGNNGRGGIEYWWRGDRFLSATYAEWDTSPPRPVASWTLHRGDDVITGTGTPSRGTGLLEGRFA